MRKNMRVGELRTNRPSLKRTLSWFTLSPLA
jgi:hypothetical protein